MVVVFDLDGTLIDSRAALLAAHDVAWSQQGLPRPPDEAILSLVGLPLVDTMLRLAPHCDPIPLVEDYSQAYSAAAASCEQLFDGMHAILSRSFRAAVATGKSQLGADRTVERHGLAERFEVVLGANSVPNPKPHPDLLIEVARLTDCSELIMIGDTTYDLEMAQRAGVPAIGVSWGHHSTDMLERFAPVAHSVDELDAMLCRHLE